MNCLIFNDCRMSFTSGSFHKPNFSISASYLAAFYVLTTNFEEDQDLHLP